MALGPLMIDLVGTELSAQEQQLVCHPLVGGIILFSRNYQSITQLKKLIQSIRALRSELLLAVDQEGGRVQRFVDGFTKLPAVGSFMQHYKNNVEQASIEIEVTAYKMASELLEIGIDISFAPVLDINYGLNSVIAERSFADNADNVIRLAGAYIKGMNRAGMQATGKHFPGHGAVTADSHFNLPIDLRNFSEIKQTDLQPFIQLTMRLGAVMSAHIIYKNVDEQLATFSSFWLQEVLRNQLHFQGAVFSDDLTMQAAAAGGDYPARVKAALAAGCDMVLVCNNRQAVFEILANLDYAMPKLSQQRLLNMKGENYNASA